MALRALCILLLAFGLTTQAMAGCAGRDLTADWTAAERAAVEAATRRHPYPTGRYWEVSRNGRTSVLFGTIHLTDADVATPPPALADDIRAARVLMIEVTREEEKRMQRALILNPSLVLAPKGKRLRPMLNSQDWRMLDSALTPFGLDADTANRLSPWFLTLMLATPPCVLEQQYAGAPILDRRIESMAETAQVKVLGLETYEDLFEILGGGSYEEQVEFLRMSLPTLSRAEDLLATSKTLYQQGQIMMIWETGAQMMRDQYGAQETDRLLDLSREMLLGVRNRAWMKRLIPELKRGNAVVAVGALHLGGDTGLLHLLEQEGFEIRALSE